MSDILWLLANLLFGVWVLVWSIYMFEKHS